MPDIAHTDITSWDSSLFNVLFYSIRGGSWDQKHTVEVMAYGSEAMSWPPLPCFVGSLCLEKSAIVL